MDELDKITGADIEKRYKVNQKNSSKLCFGV